jgi:hypothetical protein
LGWGLGWGEKITMHFLSFNRVKRGHKYNAKKTKCEAGHNHPSALESSVCKILHQREEAGEISAIKWIAPVELGFGVRWKVDFSFVLTESGKTVYCEAKGVEDAGYKVKKKMWENGAGPGRLEIWKGSHKKPKLFKVIEPKKVKTKRARK